MSCELVSRWHNCQTNDHIILKTYFIVLPEHVQSHLTYPHIWVQLASSQLFGLLFAAWQPDQLVTMATKSSTHYLTADLPRKVCIEVEDSCNKGFECAILLGMLKLSVLCPTHFWTFDLLPLNVTRKHEFCTIFSLVTCFDFFKKTLLKLLLNSPTFLCIHTIW